VDSEQKGKLILEKVPNQEELRRDISYILERKVK
jgi:hypothetical protein